MQSYTQNHRLCGTLALGDWETAGNPIMQHDRVSHLHKPRWEPVSQLAKNAGRSPSLPPVSRAKWGAALNTTGAPPRRPQRYRFEPDFVRLFDLNFKHKVPCSIFNVTVALWRGDGGKIHVEAQVFGICTSQMTTVLVVPRN